MKFHSAALAQTVPRSSPLKGERFGWPLGPDQALPAATLTRLAATVRLIVCFAAMYLALAQSQPTAATAYALLNFAFAIYSAALYWRAIRDPQFQEPQLVYWIDTFVFLVYTLLTGSSQSHYALFLPVPLVFVSLRWGFRPSMSMAACAAAGVLFAGLLGARQSGVFLAGDVLLPPVALLVLGYLMATWANSNRALSRRFASLRDFNALFNPRFNIEQTIDRVVRHIAGVYPLEHFALVLVEAGQPPRAYRAHLPKPMYQASATSAMELDLATRELAPGCALIYRGKRGILPAEVHSSKLEGQAGKAAIAQAAAVAERLGSNGFGAVAFALQKGGTARLFVWSETASFSADDLLFFTQLGEQLSPRLGSAQLLDRLASEVADHERQKISRDLHDSAIQPYIGLKFGLEALRRKVAPADPIAGDIVRLVDMANTEINELRRYVRGLRDHGEPGHAALVPALRRHAARFGDLYGIQVSVDSSTELGISDELANEAFHIVSEGLSNVRRHTTASRARLTLARDVKLFTLAIANPCDPAGEVKMFKPRSIVERAAALGGVCRVETQRRGETVVTVEIPLQG